ncbi:LysR family transcriptional regulator [Sodalis sp. RH21]|uniref:LysR family transcriptional regulator n=1 Tax=unclassified Sodalis (in: enterobacteria) TaxID=2636512 RepID=UPI0039B60C48
MLRELKTFLAVFQYGTFSAAGQRIGLTQSAVSAQIRILEQAIGMQLFDRTGRTAVLNAAGIRILPMAEEIVAIFSRMSQPDNVRDYHGPIKIGAIATVQTGILPNVLLRLHQEAPAIEPKLIPGLSFNLLGEVEAGNIDLALVIKPGFPLTKELYYETLQLEPFVLITPSDMEELNPIAILRNQPFIRYDRTSFGGRLVSQFLREHHIDPCHTLEIDEIDSIVKMVEVGLGVALVPLAGLWMERKMNIRVISLGELTFHRELILIMRYSQRQSSLNMLFKRCLFDELPHESKVKSSHK